MDNLLLANTSRFRQSIPPQSKVFCVISHENISNDQKRMKIRSLADDKNKLTFGSCLFLKTEALDYSLVPSFPNYMYSFTSLLVPTVILRKRLDGIIRLIMCVSCSLLALVHTLLQLRQRFDACMENKELYNYVFLLSSALAVLTCGQVLNILLRRRILLLRTFWHPTSEEYIQNKKTSAYNHNTRKTHGAAKAFFYGYLVYALFRVGTTDFDNLTDWTLTELLQINADYIMEFLGAVPTPTETNATMSYPFLNASDESIQLETVLLGSAGCALQLASFLTLSYAQVLFLFAGLTMKEVSEKLVSLLSVSLSDGRKIKHTYEFIFQSSSSLDLSIGELLAVQHVQVFLYFVLVLRMMLADGVAIDICRSIWYFPDFAITTATYYYATRAPGMINTFRSWIRNKENQEILRLDAISIQTLFDELTTNPGGIGKGIFYVNAELFAKLLSSIGTFFLVIATRTD